MRQGVSKQLFQQLAGNAQARLETAEASADGAAAAAAPEAAEPIRIVPLVFGVVGSSIADFFRRLFGQSKS